MLWQRFGWKMETGRAVKMQVSEASVVTISNCAAIFATSSPDQVEW